MTYDLVKRCLGRVSALYAALALACLVPMQGSAVAADAFNTRFVAIAFHDVVDRAVDLDDDAITTDRLVAFFDWLRGNGWHAISLDDVARAGRGEQPLPAKAVLITFDDGHRSLYTRAYPLLLAYRMPAVAALVGAWVDAGPGTTVRYGDREIPRESFISWDQAREMQRSGLVEFALHSYDLHRALPANPQGNTMPAAVTRRFTPPATYETEAAFAQRLRDDLVHGRALLQRELGHAPRTLAWPYGRYDAIGAREAQAAGFTHLLTLDPGLADARVPLAVNRYFPTHNPSLSDLVANLRPEPHDLRVARFACLDPATVWSGDAGNDDARLGRVIERIRAIGLTAVVVDGAQRDAQGRVTAAWFPNRELPMAGDLLSRIAWQLQTRAGVAVHVRLPHREVAQAVGNDESRVLRLFDDLGAVVPLSGWVMEHTGEPPVLSFEDLPSPSANSARAQSGWAAWVVHERRRANLQRLQQPDRDALAWRVFARLEAARPGLQLLWLAPSSAAESVAPHPLVDFTLIPHPLGSSGEVGAAAPADPRMARWFTTAKAPEAARLVPAALAYQRQGGIAFGWCPDDALADRPATAAAARVVSAATFPVRR